MTKGMGSRTVGAMMAGLLLCAGALQAGLEKDLKKDVENIKHALGWDTINLTAIERDKEGRPTLERENNASNIVERRTSYQKNGNKDAQSVDVVSKSSKKSLFTEKKTWNDKGDLDSDLVQDDVFHRDGRQMKGLIVDRKFKDGKLVVETRKHFSPEAAEWGHPMKQSMKYYADGDLRERITEDPASDTKTRETWSAKEGALGRKSTTENWNASRHTWE